MWKYHNVYGSFCFSRIYWWNEYSDEDCEDSRVCIEKLHKTVSLHCNRFNSRGYLCIGIFVIVVGVFIATFQISARFVRPTGKSFQCIHNCRARHNSNRLPKPSVCTQYQMICPMQCVSCSSLDNFIQGDLILLLLILLREFLLWPGITRGTPHVIRSAPLSEVQCTLMKSHSVEPWQLGYYVKKPTPYVYSNIM